MHILGAFLFSPDFSDWSRNLTSNNADCGTNGDPVTIVHSTNIRIILSIIYILVETVRDGCQTANSNSNGHSATATMTKPQTSAVLDHTAKLREQFIEELGTYMLYAVFHY